jgi:DNA-binding helix-hairpin-helix protein with protein kinase domain
MQVLRCLTKQEILNLTISLGRGGEACIYAVPSDSNLVAKVYHKPTEQHGRKLLAMLANPPENPTASLDHISIAWPYEALKAVDGSDRIVGFLMPRIRSMRPAIDFYNPRTRREHCPLFNYQYLLRTARNLAAAFAALHNSGYCVGDVNESNIMVSDTALVTLVDTDSFQVRDENQNITFRCQVGKPEFTPPELQNKIFAQYDRAIAHDLFGLGVLIFQLLMEGTHPFSGIYQGAGEPPTYEGRIAQGHFTYSQQRRVPYTPTPIAPAWETLPPSLQEMFVRCFEHGHNNPQMRPSAQTWLLELAEIENDLITCTVNPQHRYSSHLHKCPWCERTLRLGGRDPFPSQQAIESKQHLQPRKQTRRSTTATRSNVSPIPVNQINYRQLVQSQKFSYYQSPKKSKFYAVIFCLLGIGMLGYLDVMVKFTRPLVSQNKYAQQTLMSRQEESKNNPNFEDYYKQGYASYKARDYEQAVSNFSHAIHKDPTHPKAHINLGNARYNLKDYDGAITDYSQAIQINPNEIKAYVNRGNARYMLAEYSSDPDRDYNLALADFNNALRLNPNEAEAYIRRGIVRSQLAKYSGDSQQDYHKAIGDFNQAIALNAAKSEAYFQRGLVRYQIGQYSSDFEQEYKEAIADFNQALRIDSRLAKVYLKRGIVRYEISQYGGKQSNTNHTQAIVDLQISAKIFLEQEDMDNYQQALSSICVVLENKCDTFFENTTSLLKGN